MKCINKLIFDVKCVLFDGIGKLEFFKENFLGFWFCRIDDINCLVYVVDDVVIMVILCCYYY